MGNKMSKQVEWSGSGRLAAHPAGQVGMALEQRGVRNGDAAGLLPVLGGRGDAPQPALPMRDARAWLPRPSCISRVGSRVGKQARA